MSTSVQIFQKDKLEELEEERLAPYALKSRRSQRLLPATEEGRKFDYRTEFQHDRDRIIHSLAFRRLKHKTQVYLPYDNDHHRTRLTHTIEVSQISRTIARALLLNEDLTEAIALGHDLGHTPFGQAGEELLDKIMRGAETLGILDRELLRKGGGFRHNYQSVRVVDHLEQRYPHNGINLTNDTREGILKHIPFERRISYPGFTKEGLHTELAPPFEAQVVALADELAQQTHDLEDGMRAREVALEKVEELAIARRVIKRIAQPYSSTTNRYLKQNMLIRGIIHLCVTDVIRQSARSLSSWTERHKINSTENFYAKRELIKSHTIGFSPQGKRLFQELKYFVHKFIINSFAINRADGRARHFLSGLFRAYYQNPRQLDSYQLLRFKELEGVRYLRDVPSEELDKEIKNRYQRNLRFIRLICDHIAGMSDWYALREYERLYLPSTEFTGF